MLESFNSGKFEYKRLPLEEQRARGILGRLVGVMADTKNPTRNGRTYSLDLWKKVFDSDLMREKIANRCLFGEIGHPADREETDPEKIAICLAEQPKIGRDGKIYGVFDILDTPNGRILKSLCDYGCNIGISSRGSGDLITDYDGNESVDPETYSCEAWDAVLVPAVKEARLQYVTEALSTKKYNKTLRQRLNEQLDKASDNDRKVMNETLMTLGFNLNEDLNESSTQELQTYFKQWQTANPDIDLNKFINEYCDEQEENLGSIMYNESKYLEFVKWCSNKGVKIKSIDGKDSTPAPGKNSNEEEKPNTMVADEEPEYVDTEEQADESLNEDGEIATQLSDVTSKDLQPISSEGLMEDATDSDSEAVVPVSDEPFYVRETQAGTEVIYRGYVIYLEGDKIFYDIDGDEVEAKGKTDVEKVQDAINEIDKLSSDPDYYTDSWHFDDCTKIASFDALKTTLGLDESLYIKKGKDFKKHESVEEEAEPVDESFLTSLDEDLDNCEDPQYLYDQIDNLENEILTLSKEASRLGAKKVSRTLQNFLDLLDTPILDESTDQINEDRNALMGRGYTNAIRAINDGITTDEDEEALQKYLQEIIGYCRSIADDYGLLVESKDNKLKEELEADDDDGWGESVRDICYDLFEKFDEIMYEVRNCRRGSYANVGSTVEDLAEYLDGLSNECADVAYNLEHSASELQESTKRGSYREGDNVTSNEAVAGLKEALKKANKLEKDNLSLQEKLSASNAREAKLEEELAHYKQATVTLSKSAKETKSLKEELEGLDKESKKLVEKLDSANSTAKKLIKENGKILEENDEALKEIDRLNEKLKQLTTKNNEELKQLNESKELVEKYRKSYKSLKEAYVETKAQYYGVSKDAALKLLGESYKVSDVDKTLRELGATKRNIDKLPVDLNESVKLSKANLSIKSNEKINSLDDTSLDSLKSLLW